MMMAVLTTQSKVFWGADLRGDNFIKKPEKLKIFFPGL